MNKNREYEVGEIVETFGHSDYWESQLLKEGYKFSIVDVDGGHVKYQITEVIEPVTSAEKIEMLHKILDIVMQINEGAEAREGNGHPTAFYSYSGHVNALHINIYEDGWTNGNPYTAFDISFNEPTLYTANKVYDELVNIRKTYIPKTEVIDMGELKKYVVTGVRVNNGWSEKYKKLNEDWFKDCRKLNNEWFEFLIDSARKDVEEPK